MPSKYIQPELRRYGSLRVPHLNQNIAKLKQARQHPVARYRDGSGAHKDVVNESLIGEATICALEDELRDGESMAALSRFNALLRGLPQKGWRTRLAPVFSEFAFNLESFNPAFAAVIYSVQASIGASDYRNRDAALKHLIVPLAGEYGMHNAEPQSKTHRELFDDWTHSLLGVSAPDLISAGADPVLAHRLFACMMRDLRGPASLSGHSIAADGAPAAFAPSATAIDHACYALGYNLAIEFLADYEKQWMLESFRQLDRRFLAAEGVRPDWIFLEVHAEDEVEHAAIGHAAVRSFVPEAAAPLLRRAMCDHDRDFAVFYNGLADMLEA